MALISRVGSIYFSTQFAKYIVCGSVSSSAHIIARWIFNQYMEFGWAVFLSFFVGMPVALILYRLFVFQGRDGSVIRQFILFSLAYFGFLPLTWTLSVISEPGLEVLMYTAWAQLAAHTIGLIGPVALNFAYNKFITFGERIETD